MLFGGKQTLFAHCAGELLALSKELKGKSSSLDLQLHPSRLGYIGQCMRYLSTCYVCYHDEECVKSLFGQSALYNSRDHAQCGAYEQFLELSLLGMASRNREVRWNGQLLAYFMLFDPYVAVTAGTDRMQISIQEVILSAFSNTINAGVRFKA